VEEPGQSLVNGEAPVEEPKPELDEPKQTQVLFSSVWCAN